MENEFKLTLENLFTIVRQEVLVCNPSVNYFYFGTVGNKGLYALFHDHLSIPEMKPIRSFEFFRVIKMAPVIKSHILLNKQKFIKVALICMCLHELGKNPYLGERGIFPDYLIAYLLKP